MDFVTKSLDRMNVITKVAIITYMIAKYGLFDTISPKDEPRKKKF